MTKETIGYISLAAITIAIAIVLSITMHKLLGIFIKRYAKKLNLSVAAACLKVLGETEKVLNLILKGGSHDV